MQLLQLKPLPEDTTGSGGGITSPQPRDGHRGRQQRIPRRHRPSSSSSFCPVISSPDLHRLPLLLLLLLVLDVLLHARTPPRSGPRAQVAERLAVHIRDAPAAAAGIAAGGTARDGRCCDVAVGMLVVGAGGGAGHQGAHQAVAASQGPFTAVLCVG